MKFLLVFTLALVLAGCASTGGFYSHRKTEQSGVLRSRFPNPLKIVGRGEASVFFEAIDGSRIMPNLLTGDVRQADVDPGTHRVAVGCKAGVAPIRIGRVEVVLLVAPSAEYLFTAKTMDGGFLIEIWDSRDGQDSQHPLQTAFAPVVEQVRVYVIP